MKKDRFYKIRVFVIALIVSLLVFGAMFAATYYFVILKEQQAMEQLIDVSMKTDYVANKEDNLAFVFMGCKERNQVPEFFFLIKFDVTTNRCCVIEVPPAALSTVQVKTKTIAEHYTYGSMEGAAKAVGNLLLLDVERYIRMDQNSLQTFVDFFSGITYYVPHDITTNDYQFKEGEQLLDGRRVVSLLFSPAFYEKSDLIAHFLSTYLNDHLTNKLDSFYDLIFQKTDTNLNRAIFNELDRPIHYFLRASSRKFLSFSLDGNATENGLLPNKDTLEQLRKQVSDKEVA